MIDVGEDAWRYQFDDPDRQFVEDKYRNARKSAMLVALDVLRSNPEIELPELLTLEEIGFKALKAMSAQWRQRDRKVQWNWAEMYRFWRRKQHSRWSLAIWGGSELWALALGHTSRNKTILYFDGVERHPAPNQRVRNLVFVSLTVAETYARLIGADTVLVVDPHRKVVEQYEAMGYTMKKVFNRVVMNYAEKRLE